MLEYLIINRPIGDYTIISCIKQPDKGGYRLRYRCGNCGNVKESRLVTNKPCILSCDSCPTKIYLIPILENGEIVWFKQLGQGGYRKLYKEYKESSSEDNIVSYFNKKYSSSMNKDS